MFKKIVLSGIIAFSLISLSGCDDNNVDSKAIKTTESNISGVQPKLSLEQISKNKKIFNDIIEETSGITYGKSESPIIIFFDPQCPHCHDLFVNTQSEEFKNQKFIWIPVAFLNQNSSLQAETILSSINPAQTFLEHEKIYSENKIGIQPISIISQEIKDKIIKNNKVFEDTKFTGVPVMIKLSKSGTLEAIPGGGSIEYIRDFVKK